VSLLPAGEGRWSADRADVCPDDRGSVSVPEKSRGRLFSGVKTWPKRLRREQTAERYQQSRRPVSANDDGARRALMEGLRSSLWGKPLRNRELVTEETCSQFMAIVFSPQAIAILISCGNVVSLRRFANCCLFNTLERLLVNRACLLADW
jgi:hypothetical protein